MTKPEFETPSIDTAGRVPIDIDRLIVTKILATANSGGGKGWLLRRILEQTYGHVPHVVFDPEGEFHTLREKFGYLLFGPDGDAPAHLEHASRMPAKILQTGCSAIIDLSDLRITRDTDERAEYIRRFLEAMMQIPRAQWKPVLVVLDEAQLWVPEKGIREAASTAAVLDFMTRGRKRGFGAILATQRLSELHKTAAAECQNRLIGRTSLDVDQQRAGKSLGMKPADYRNLSDLEDGQFFAFGPALSRAVQLVQVGGTVTSHHKVGGRGEAPTPAPASIRRMIAEFSDIPKEVAKETNELATLKRDYIALLEESQKLRTQAMPGSMQSLEIGRLKASVELLSSEHKKAREREEEAVARLAEREKAFEAIWENVATELDFISDRAIAARNAVVENVEDMVAREDGHFTERVKEPAPTLKRTHYLDALDRLAGSDDASANGLSKLERALLTSLAQHGASEKVRVLKLANYRPGGNTATAFAKLAREGWTESTDGLLAITPAGKKALGAFEPLPTGKALRDHIMNGSKYTSCDKRVLQAAINLYPTPQSRGRILEVAGYQPGGNTATAFGKLINHGFLVKSGKNLVASKDLF